MAVQAAADAAELERLRVTKLGLPPVPPPSKQPQGTPGAGQRAVNSQAPPSSQFSPEQVHQKLQQLGQQLAQQLGQQQANPEDMLQVARLHLAGMDPARVTLDELTIILADYKHLSLQYSRSLGGAVQIGAMAGPGPSPQPLPLTPPASSTAPTGPSGNSLVPSKRTSAGGGADLTVLLSHVMSCSSPFLHTDVDDLRMGDVEGLVKAYKARVTQMAH